MTAKRLALLLSLLVMPVFAKDVTYRLTGAEPLTFTIPDDWSSGWSPIKCSGFDPEAPIDLITFSKPSAPSADSAPPRINDLALLVDARKGVVPLASMKMQLRTLDTEAQAIIPAKELHSRTDGTLIGYFHTDTAYSSPGELRLNAFWNLGSRTWSASSTFPADQTNWVGECIAIIESVRLADPETAPPTPARPTINGVEDPDFPEALMEEWRQQHE